MCYCLYWARESLQLQHLTTPSPQLDSWQSVTSWDTSLETKILCVFTVWRNSSVCYSSDWKEFSELKSEAAGGFYATFSCNFFMCFQANLSCKNQCWSHKIVAGDTFIFALITSLTEIDAEIIENDVKQFSSRSMMISELGIILRSESTLQPSVKTVFIVSCGYQTLSRQETRDSADLWDLWVSWERCCNMWWTTPSAWPCNVDDDHAGVDYF